MTIDTSSLTAAQARVAQIQSLFAAPTGPAEAPTSAASPTTGGFGDAMARAQGSTGKAAGAVAQHRAGDDSAALVAPAPTLRATAPTQSSGTARNDGSAGRSLGLKDTDAVLATAKTYLGVPYRWGGTNPRTGLDCSGFVQLVMKQHGMSLPRVARDQARQGAKVASLAEARPGDLVAFGRPVHHIGIYVGDGKMIHAPRTGDVVKISKVHKDLTAIRRVLPEQASASPLDQIPAAAERARTTTGSASVASSPLPAAGLDTTRLASTLRTAAISPSHVDSSTWQEVVAGAVRDSLVGSDVENADAVLQSALAGLGTSGAASSSTAMLDAASRAASAAATLAAGGGARTTLAPDALGTGALQQAPAHLQRLFRDAESRYGVPATLLAAVAKQESGFKATAVSHAGAQGLMQLMPGTARGLGVRNSFDPAQAVDGAARLLRSHLRTFGSTELALAAYNAGAGAVRRYDGIPPYAETRNYVRRIMAGLGVSA